MNDIIQKLESFLGELRADEKTVKQSLNDNNFKIEKIDKYLSSLYEREDEDFRVFSPRNVESIYGDQIASQQEEKNQLEEENRAYYKQINKLDKQIEQLSQILEAVQTLNLQQEEMKDFDDNCDDNPKVENSISQECITNQNHLKHLLTLILSYISMDSNRAKVELSHIIDCL